MKCLQFTIPAPFDKSVIVEKVKLPYHYPYLHRHIEFQLTWIQKGEGTLIAGNNMHHYTAGDIFLIGANLPHVFKSNTEPAAANADMEVEAATIYFNPKGILAPLFSLPELSQVLVFLQQHQQGFKVPAEVAHELSDIITGLQKVAVGTDQLVLFFNMLKALTGIESKLESLAANSHLSVAAENEGIRIGNVHNYILQHYEKEITLEDVANLAFMTPESFCRYFKKHTGHTFISFLNEVRVNEACKKLIANKYESINIIAHQCGFNSMTNFNRVFKVLTGNSPRNFIDHYRNNRLRSNRMIN